MFRNDKINVRGRVVVVLLQLTKPVGHQLVLVPSPVFFGALTHPACIPFGRC